MKIKIPGEVLKILKELLEQGFDSYIVGGCVRDILLKKNPKDWDIATQAKPEEIQKLFPESVYENQFGTVIVKTESNDPTLKTIEVTTFRKEGKYSDKRHPDFIGFAENINEDLSRRDFTINAIALKIEKEKITNLDFQVFEEKDFQIIDPFKGKEDLKKKLVRAVGDPNQRFQEDALRLLRAIRFACELDFEIEKNTFLAIKNNSHLLKYIASERIRDEFLKIILSQKTSQGIILLKDSGLLKIFLPELEEGIGVTQNKHHIYTVFEHLIRSLDYAVQKNYSLEIRLASLFHDIGKPRTKEGEGPEATFYNHEIVSTKMTEKILKRLKIEKKVSQKILILVRYHGFVYDPEITTDSAIRRLILKVGKENIFDLAKVREADRIGSGCPKAKPFRLRHFLFKVEKILKEMSGEQISLKTLKVNGHDVMQVLNIKPSKKIGYILNILLEEILDDPSKNNREFLLKEIQKLGQLSDKDLEKRQKKAQEKYKALLEKEEEILKRKHRVK
ncbi:MAG: CCA tRNA nucleotidyltransferase [Minisyncoccia bacterium]